MGFDGLKPPAVKVILLWVFCFFFLKGSFGFPSILLAFSLEKERQTFMN